MDALQAIGLLLISLLFMYAVAGMQLFGRVKRQNYLNEHFNFESFGRSMSTLFRMATGEDWNGIMHDCQVLPPYCTLVSFYFLHLSNNICLARH
jgi:hypothetical protein